MSMKDDSSSIQREPWNKGRLVGQKRPLKPKDVWAIRVRLEIAGSKRNLALFNLAIDSKLRACDLVVLKVEDVCLGGRVRDRATIIQRKTGRPVQRCNAPYAARDHASSTELAPQKRTLSHSGSSWLIGFWAAYSAALMGSATSPLPALLWPAAGSIDTDLS